MTVQFRIGDVFDRLAEIPDGSIDLVVTSPPFLALRSYLPADHPDKHKEIGSEPTPAEFLDTLLALSAEWGRVLAPHGSICVELGDTYSGAGGYGSPDSPNPAYGKASHNARFEGRTAKRFKRKDDGWPLAKSMCLIPHLYTASLAYGRNLLTGEPSPAGQWRIRNVICWARPNPPVGALGDKFRPATSYITVACRGAKRYFDLDAVRTEYLHPDQNERNGKRGAPTTGTKGPNIDRGDLGAGNFHSTTGGAPPLDWHADDHPEDGDWLWRLPTQPYKGSHYATFPLALPKRLIEAMCPQRVCTVCGKPSERIVEKSPEYAAARASVGDFKGADRSSGLNGTTQYVNGTHMERADNITAGWTDCGHDAWRIGIVLDPFAGSGTTLAAALAVGRHAIGIDLDERNADLARERVGMFLEVEGTAG